MCVYSMCVVLHWPLPNSQEMLYFFPAVYLRRLRVEEVFQEWSGFLCRALSPRMRCRPAQSAKLYNLSKDLAGRNPQSSCNFDSAYAHGVTWPSEHDREAMFISWFYCSLLPKETGRLNHRLLICKIALRYVLQTFAVMSVVVSQELNLVFHH